MASNPKKWARKVVALEHEIVAQVKRYRFQNEIASESEAIRVLVRAGLDAEAAKILTNAKA